MKRFFLTMALVLICSASQATAQTAVTCAQNAQTLAGDPGATHVITCPAGCGTGTIWGSGIYSDDSSVCSAAIHAGVLTTAGGTATVTILAGLETYPASTSNGITSAEWGSWGRSFSVTGAATNAIDCSTNAQGLAGDPGAVHVVTCPAGCGTGTAWGTGVYSDDSSVCTAAIHAGVLTAAGGTVTLTIAPGLEAYPASTANGITTADWGSWSRSFTVSP